MAQVTAGGTVTPFATVGGNPTGLAFDSRGNLFVSSILDGTVDEITPSGSVSLFASGFNYPEGLAFDGSGNLLVANLGGPNGGVGSSSEISVVGPSGINRAGDNWLYRSRLYRDCHGCHAYAHPDALSDTDT